MLKKCFFVGLAVFVIACLSVVGCQSAPEQHSGEAERREELSEQHDGKEEDMEKEDSEMEKRTAEDEVKHREVKLQFLGHSCFLIEVDDFRILTDPYSPDIGYGTLNLKVDLITVSHEHNDHNYTEASPEAQVLRGLTPDALGWEDISFSVGDINISTLATYHDGSAGKSRGRNAAFIFDIADLRIVHLGDLGHTLNEGDLEKLKEVDVLLTPVGGHYTIDAQQAKEIIEKLAPAVVVPMHYKTKVTRNWPIAELKTFLEGEEKVIEKGEKPVTIAKDKLPESTEIWVLEISKP